MSPRRLLYIDALTVLACFSVVMLHTNSAVFSYRQGQTWHWINVPIEFVFLWAVPVFLMISGATIIGYNKKYDLKTYATHRIKRAVIPFLFWNAFGLVVDIFVFHTVEQGLGARSYLQMLISISSPTLNILWFFMPLFAFYLCAPALSSIPEEKRIRIFTYLILISFITIFLLPNICTVFGLTYNSEIENPMASGFLIYPLLGYVLSRISIPRKIEIGIHAAGFLGLIAMVCGTWLKSSQANSLILFLSDAQSTAVLFMSTSIFLLAKRINRRIETIPSATWLLSRIPPLCLGIYFTHRFFLVIITHYFPGSYLLWWWPLLLGPTIFVISATAARVLQLIPVIKHLI